MINYSNKHKLAIIQSIICMIVLTVLFLQTNSAKAQFTQFSHSQFSQVYAAPLSLAPSFAGASDGSRITLNYRNQWPSVSSAGTFSTFAFGFDHFFHKYNSGLGLLLFSDQAGSADLSTTHAGLQYSYDIALDQNWRMRPGLHFLYGQRTINHDKLIFIDQYDLYDLQSDEINNNTEASIPVEDISYFDASASMVVAFRQMFWFGASFDHLMSPDQSMIENQESPMPLRSTVFGAYRHDLKGQFGVGPEESLIFTFLYKNKDLVNQLDLGGYYARGNFSFGLMYRGVLFFAILFILHLIVMQ